MRIKSMSVFWILLMVLAVGKNSHAEFLTDRIGLGARAGIVDVSEDKDMGYSFDYGNNPLFGANATYHFTHYLSVELSAEYTRADLKTTSAAGVKFDIGELERLPIWATLRYHFPTNSLLIPYAGIGAGFIFNRITVDNQAKTVLGASTRASIDNSYGVHACAGAEYFLNKNMAVTLDLRYVFIPTELEVEAAGAGPLQFDLETNGIVAGGGIKYYF